MMGKNWHYWLLLLSVYMLSDIQFSSSMEGEWFDLKFPIKMQPPLIHLSWGDENGLSLDFASPFASKTEEDNDDYGSDYEFEEDSSEDKSTDDDEIKVERRGYRNKIF